MLYKDIHKKTKDGIGASKGLFTCNYDAHDKHVHFECFENLVKTTYENKHLVCMEDGKEAAIFVCGKQCYKNYNKTLEQKKTVAQKKTTAHWKTDRSVEYLVWWLSDGRNYSSWMGSEDLSNNTKSDTATGLKKTAICIKISTKMRNDIEIEWSGESIKRTLYDLFAQYKAAADNALNTGEGIRQDQGEESFHEHMILPFVYYCDLEPVLASCHFINPAYTTDTVVLDGDKTNENSVDKSMNNDININNDSNANNTPSPTTPTTPTTVSKKRKHGKAKRSVIKGFYNSRVHFF